MKKKYKRGKAGRSKYRRKRRNCGCGNPRRKILRPKRTLSVPEKHQLRIALQTLKMPDAMVGVMGGPNKAESREIIKRLTGRTARGNPLRSKRRLKRYAKKDSRVPVKFRIEGKDDIYALFPTIEGSPGYCTAYQHVGGHSSADYRGCMRRSKPATRAQYASLKRELESYPYKYRLKVK